MREKSPDYGGYLVVSNDGQITSKATSRTEVNGSIS